MLQMLFDDTMQQCYNLYNATLPETDHYRKTFHQQGPPFATFDSLVDLCPCAANFASHYFPPFLLFDFPHISKVTSHLLPGFGFMVDATTV